MSRWYVDHPKYGRSEVLAKDRRAAAWAAAGYRHQRGTEWEKECFITRLER